MSKQYAIMNKKTGKFLLHAAFGGNYSKFGSLQSRNFFPMTKADCIAEMHYAKDDNVRCLKDLVIKEIKFVVVK